MEIQFIRKEEVQPGIWSGGKTWELFIWPPDKKYANRDFDFRISTASIEETPSDFTRFNGYRRYLVMLDNDLEIIRNGKSEHYPKHQIFEFDSSDEIKSFSAGNDFNLMIRNDFSKFDLSVGQIKEVVLAEFILIFGTEVSTAKVNEDQYNIMPGDCILILNPEQESCEVETNSKVIFVMF